MIPVESESIKREPFDDERIKKDSIEGNLRLQHRKRLMRPLLL